MEFDHVAVQAPDIAEAVRWWLEQVPGSRVAHQDETWALVEAPGVRLALVSPEQHPLHLAWRVPERELDAMAEQRGAPVRTRRDGSRSFYVDGPAGLALEIIAYPGDGAPPR